MKTVIDETKTQNEMVLIEKVAEKIWFKKGSVTWSFDLAELISEGSKRSAKFTHSPDKILSNMPGKITGIFVNEGQTVQQGQPLLVIEAMKMEYTYKAELATKVEKVYFKVGDQVTVGSLLVKLAL